MSDEERFQEWQQQIDEIWLQVADLHVLRHVYQTIWQIVQSNPRLQKTPNLFWWWLNHAYISAILMGLRRLGDKMEGALSLYRLLEDIRKHPNLLSRERYHKFYEGLREQIRSAGGITEEEAEVIMQSLNIDKKFDELGGRGKPHIDPKAVEEDLKQLEEALKKVREWADKRIAHWDKKPPEKLPTHVDIDKCLELIGELMRKYYGLIKGGYIAIMPTIDYDWTEIFNFAWKWKLLPDQQKRLTQLLQKSKDVGLTEEEEAELDALINEADNLALQKALAEVAERR